MLFPSGDGAAGDRYSPKEARLHANRPSFKNCDILLGMIVASTIFAASTWALSILSRRQSRGVSKASFVEQSQEHGMPTHAINMQEAASLAPNAAQGKFAATNQDAGGAQHAQHSQDCHLSSSAWPEQDLHDIEPFQDTLSNMSGTWSSSDMIDLDNMLLSSS